MYGYIRKKAEKLDKERNYKTSAHTKDGWQQKGKKRIKKMTSAQFAEKVRRQDGRS